jgi:hypothetical protein
VIKLAPINRAIHNTSLKCQVEIGGVIKLAPINRAIHASSMSRALITVGDKFCPIDRGDAQKYFVRSQSTSRVTNPAPSTGAMHSNKNLRDTYCYL